LPAYAQERPSDDASPRRPTLEVVIVGKDEVLCDKNGAEAPEGEGEETVPGTVFPFPPKDTVKDIHAVCSHGSTHGQNLYHLPTVFRDPKQAHRIPPSLHPPQNRVSNVRNSFDCTCDEEHPKKGQKFDDGLSGRVPTLLWSVCDGAVQNCQENYDDSDEPQ
jgi:hypothetical protein